MIKLATGSWPLQGRRTLNSNATLLILVCFLAFYYACWNTLSYSSRIDPTQQTHELEKVLTCPELPPAPECPAPPPPPACPSPSPPPSPYDPTKVAFLVENRPLRHLPALYAHMASVIPPEWTFKFMGSFAAIATMRSSPLIRRLEMSGKLQILKIPSNYTLRDRESISQMFTDIKLYRDILAPAENLLVFQPDSIFCANSPRNLNDFLGYDWIGAPWSKTAQYGGNGGLSLRKVSKIINVLEKEQRKIGDGALEDLWLSDRLNQLEGKKMANSTISKTFSVESVWDKKPLGYHIGWLGVHHEQIWDDPSQVDHILEYCPEVKMILGMKLDNDKPKGIP